MRSPEHKERTKLEAFEDEVTQNLEHPENAGQSREAKKTSIRKKLAENAKTLGVSDERAQYLAMYFFSLLEENPAKGKKMWELLYQISENAQDAEKVKTAFTLFMMLSEKGQTSMWRLAHNVIKGEYEVAKEEFDGEPMYFLRTPKDRDKRVVDPKRQKSSREAKALIKDDILEKPIPNTGSMTNFLGNDKDIFLKIYRYLQADIDILIFSKVQLGEIGKYLKGIVDHLSGMMKQLEIQKGGRKNKYHKFIRAVIANYIQPLMKYAKQISSDSEQNDLARDLWIEPYLLQNKFVQNGVSTDPLKFISPKWTQLKSDLNAYVKGNATVYGIPTYDVLLAEKQNKEEAENLDFEEEEEVVQHAPTSKQRFDETLINMPTPRMTGEVPPSILKEVNERANRALSNVHSVNDTAGVQAIIDDELQPFLPDGEENTPVDTKKQSVEQAITDLSTPATILPNSELERTTIVTVRTTVARTFAEAPYINTKEGADALISNLKENALQIIQTPKLKREFYQAILLELSYIKAKELRLDNYDYLHAELTKLFSGLSKVDLPNTVELNKLKLEAPQLSESPLTRNHIIGKNLRKEAEDLEDELRGLVRKVQEMDLLIALDLNFREAPDVIGGFLKTIEDFNGLKDKLKGLRKNIEGGWHTKHLRRAGRYILGKKHTSKDLTEYFDGLASQIDKVQEIAVDPSIQFFKVAFFYTQNE